MTTMASASPDQCYMIYRHEKLGVTDVLRLLSTKRRLTDYEFVECSYQRGLEFGDVKAGWSIALLAVPQRVLFTIRKPLRWVGMVVEFFLNVLSLNGGLLGLIWRAVTASVRVPVPGSASYRSVISHIDGRFDLYKGASLVSSLPLMGQQEDLDDIDPLELSMMAAKLAYENEAYIKEVVNNHWKMHFVGYFNCWNKFLAARTTQAFVFCDRRGDARLICVAFCGTEPFNAQDWLTDADLSHISMGADMGIVHLGFMKALGIQHETDFAKGFPEELPGDEDEDKSLAYYAIRQSLRALLAEHPNAKIVVTGHSLGAALACLFPALLVYHRQHAVLDRMACVITHAQPRVGDKAFSVYMESAAAAASVRFYRMVYRHDVVPRVPFDSPPFGLFKHFGTCIYYHNWYQGQVVSEVPNPNYFLDLRYVIPMYLDAWGDLVRAFFLGRLQGRDFEESWTSILYRLSGLLIPGVASHSPRDYINGARLARIHGLK